MQIEHVLAAGFLMQTVDVLREQKLDIELAFEFGQGQVSRVRAGSVDALEAHQTSSPVALSSGQTAAEFLKAHRLTMLPLSRFVAIVRYPRVGADAGTRQHEQAACAGHSTRELSHEGKLEFSPAGVTCC